MSSHAAHGEKDDSLNVYFFTRATIEVAIFVRIFFLDDGAPQPPNRRKCVVEVLRYTFFWRKWFLNDGAPKPKIVGNTL